MGMCHCPAWRKLRAWACTGTASSGLRGGLILDRLAADEAGCVAPTATAPHGTTGSHLSHMLAMHAMKRVAWDFLLLQHVSGSLTMKMHSPPTSTWLPGRNEARLLPRCCRSVPTLQPKTRSG